MTRYTKQYDQRSCGAAVLVNALKWDGHNISWKRDKAKANKAVNATKNGTYPHDLYNTLKRHFKERFCKEAVSSMKELDKSIDDGYSAIIRHKWPKWSGQNLYGRGHYIFIDGRTECGYYVVNLKAAGKARQWIHRKTMRKLLLLRSNLTFNLLSPNGASARPL
jgi:hypothetical protein